MTILILSELLITPGVSVCVSLVLFELKTVILSYILIFVFLVRPSCVHRDSYSFKSELKSKCSYGLHLLFISTVVVFCNLHQLNTAFIISVLPPIL